MSEELRRLLDLWEERANLAHVLPRDVLQAIEIIRAQDEAMRACRSALHQAEELIKQFRPVSW